MFMNKKQCLAYLNKVIQFLPELDCFEDICEELDLEEDELELILSSKITNISNEDLE